MSKYLVHCGKRMQSDFLREEISTTSIITEHYHSYAYSDYVVYSCTECDVKHKYRSVNSDYSSDHKLKLEDDETPCNIALGVIKLLGMEGRTIQDLKLTLKLNEVPLLETKEIIVDWNPSKENNE